MGISVLQGPHWEKLQNWLSKQRNNACQSGHEKITEMWISCYNQID